MCFALGVLANPEYLALKEACQKAKHFVNSLSFEVLKSTSHK